MNKSFLMISIIYLVISMNSAMATALAKPIDHEDIDCSEKIVLKNFSLPSYNDERWDSYCSRLFITNRAPFGFVTIFGGNKLLQDDTGEYTLIRTFARKWTEQAQATRWPIATGGGEGVMNAATQGAREARRGHGKAISLTLVFENEDGTIKEEDNGNLKENTFFYREMSKREMDLINYAQAAVFGLGGVGTLWEFSEILSKIQLLKKRTIPIVILAPLNKTKEFFGAFLNLTSASFLPNICSYVNLTDSPDKAIQLISMSISQRAHDQSSACNMTLPQKNAH